MRLSIKARLVAITLTLGCISSSAFCAPQSNIEELKSQFAKASEETTSNLAKAQALEGKSDRAGYCAALRATLTSLNRKVDVLGQINDLVQKEPSMTDEKKKYLADELTTAKEGKSGLIEFIHKTCDQPQSSTGFDASTAVQKLSDAEDSGKQHLKDGVALIQAGDKPKGCVHIRAALKDYETQLDLSRKIKAALETKNDAKSDVIVKLQSSIGTLEGNIKDIKSFIATTCEGQ